MLWWPRYIRKHWAQIYFGFGCAVFVFAFGIAVGRYEVFPHRVLVGAEEAANDWRKHYLHYLKIKPHKFLKRARYDGKGVTIHDKEKSWPGVTFVTGVFDDAVGMSLYDNDGTLLHRWEVAFNRIWSSADHLSDGIAPDEWGVDVHGAKLYPNGDVVFNFEFKGLARIDKNSQPIWSLAHETHHSVYEDAQGDLWVPGRRLHSEPVDEFPLLKPPITEDLILQVSPTGEIKREISVLGVIYGSDKEALLCANGLFDPNRVAGDITHLNDIEVLEESLADRFPQFRAGDIMVSLRHLNLVMVIDSTTEKIKWSMTGPFIRQHDPDFLPNGRISIFDNRSDRAHGQVLGGSRILSVDPATKTVEVTYQGDDKNSFYTNTRGKHQVLPNGNILIAEYDTGCVFEVTPDGDFVWSLVNRYDDNEAYLVTEGVRLPLHYGDFARPSKEPNQREQ